jgi:uncharacterized protein (TIGR04255 family)
MFKKAPLVESIAELRWLPAGASGAPIPQQTGAPQLFFTNDPKIEEFFMRLGGELYQSGFQRSERLIPPGVPIVFGQAAIRFRSDDALKKSVLYQAGSSVFSVHGVPPYRSWQDFVPQMKMGVEALVKTRNALQQPPAPFTQINLRYLDFFGTELLGGRSPDIFLSEVLAFGVTLPHVLIEVAEPKRIQSAFQRFVIPVKMGTLTISVGDGKANDQVGVVLDTTVTSAAAIEPNVDSVMNTFSAAHEIISKTFRGLTKPIEQLMEPEKLEN